MNFEIINNSQQPLPDDLEARLKFYTPYHIYGEYQARLIISVEATIYDVTYAKRVIDDDHIMLWIQDWQVSVTGENKQPKEEIERLQNIQMQIARYIEKYRLMKDTENLIYTMRESFTYLNEAKGLILDTALASGVMS